MKPTYLIADLHLEAQRPDIAALFLTFLSTTVLHAQALYILGDFFEVWIGDDDTTPFNQSIINALRQLTDAGVKVYFQPGNRDFLIGKTFQRQTHCEFLPDEALVTIDAQPYLLMHGDTLCTADVKYLKFRKYSRRWLAQKLFLFKSLTKRRALAQNAREQSQDHTRTTPESIMDVTQAEVERIIRKHGITHLIHGHTHRPSTHQFELDGKTITRTVLAPWHDYGSALVIKNGMIESIDIR